MCSPFAFLIALNDLASPHARCPHDEQERRKPKDVRAAVAPERFVLERAGPHRIHFPGRGEANTGGYVFEGRLSAITPALAPFARCYI
jgi:hypothetical protein